jgi:F-type H+-transporting ATPase subunit b
MQTLDVISVNLWQILVSLLNLTILFLLIKKFLYKPVKKMLETRQNTIDGEYSAAEKAKSEALESKKLYEDKLSSAKNEADEIISNASQRAKEREKEILSEAKSEAEGILQEARENAKLEIRRAEETIRAEIVDVSTKLTEKILEREVSEDDHAALIDSFIDEIGEQDDTDK